MMELDPAGTKVLMPLVWPRGNYSHSIKQALIAELTPSAVRRDRGAIHCGAHRFVHHGDMGRRVVSRPRPVATRSGLATRRAGRRPRSGLQRHFVLFRSRRCALGGLARLAVSVALAALAHHGAGTCSPSHGTALCTESPVVEQQAGTSSGSTVSSTARMMAAIVLGTAPASGQRSALCRQCRAATPQQVGQLLVKMLVVAAHSLLD